jgi:hypothetical protein
MTEIVVLSVPVGQFIILQPKHLYTKHSSDCVIVIVLKQKDRGSLVIRELITATSECFT